MGYGLWVMNYLPLIINSLCIQTLLITHNPLTLPEPIGVKNIIIGSPFNFTVDEILGYILNLSGGNATINDAMFNFGIFKYHSSRSNDSIAAYFRPTHNDRCR